MYPRGGILAKEALSGDCGWPVLKEAAPGLFDIALRQWVAPPRPAYPINRAEPPAKYSPCYRSVTWARTGGTFLKLIHPAELNGTEQFEAPMEQLNHPRL